MKEHKNIKEELQDISPFLANLKKQDDGFDVPQNYFNTLEDNIFARIKAEEEVEAWNISETENTSTISRQSWMQRIMGWFAQPQVSLSLAAMVIVGIGFALFQMNNQSEEIGIAEIDWTMTSDEALASLTIDEVNQYLEENVEDFSEDLLSEAAEGVIVEKIIQEPTEKIILPVEPQMDVDLEELKEYIEENISEFDEDMLVEEY